MCFQLIAQITVIETGDILYYLIMLARRKAARVLARWGFKLTDYVGYVNFG